MLELLLPLRWRWALGALLAAALLGALGLQRHNAQQQAIGAQRERSLCQAQALQSEQAAHARQLSWMTEVNHAQSQAQQHHALALAAQRAAADAGRLFSASLAGQRGHATAVAGDAGRADGATLAALLDQCQAAYRELAAEADGHAADSLMLQQAWPR